jgi:hypothetical protein
MALRTASALIRRFSSPRNASAHHVPDRSIDLRALRLRQRLLEEPADPVDHVACSIGLPHDAIERFSYLVHVRRSTIQKVPSGLSVGDYRCNGLRHFGGDRGREPSYRCDPIDLRQIDLRLVQAFGGQRQRVRSD